MMVPTYPLIFILGRYDLCLVGGGRDRLDILGSRKIGSRAGLGFAAPVPRVGMRVVLDYYF